MNAVVGSLSLLQRILPIQELHWGLMYGRWILYQLSYQGNLDRFVSSFYIRSGNLNLQDFLLLYTPLHV